MIYFYLLVIYIAGYKKLPLDETLLQDLSRAEDVKGKEDRDKARMKQERTERGIVVVSILA